MRNARILERVLITSYIPLAKNRPGSDAFFSKASSLKRNTSLFSIRSHTFSQTSSVLCVCVWGGGGGGGVVLVTIPIADLHVYTSPST